MRIKKLLSAFCAAAIAFNALTMMSSAVDLQREGTSVGCNVATRTEDEIRNYLKTHPFNQSAAVEYEVAPDIASNVIGKLSSKTLTDALNALNSMRYIAGLGEVMLDDNECTLAQAASFVGCANRQNSHYPTQPSGVSKKNFDLGYKGASSSNLAWGHLNPTDSIIGGYMEDSDESNIDRLGHRRWCLNPKMGKTGFGQVGMYSAMRATDTSNTGSTENNVCWPAQTMPVEYFASSHAWSLSTGQVLSNTITVTLTRKSDSNVWMFSTAKSDGDFYVDNTGYGQKGCIIFRPNGIDEFKDGDSFSVKIEGLAKSIAYDVNFFSLDDTPSPETTAALTFSPNGGTFTEAQSVTISCATKGAEIYYTLDGSEPTADSAKYTAAVSIPESKTLKAISVKDGVLSDVVSADFTINIPASSTSKSAKISYLSMTLGKGSSVQLGTVLSGSSSQKVTWTSSKSSVVSVSSSGKISCKKKGTATITAKLGSSKVKIKIKVK